MYDGLKADYQTMKDRCYNAEQSIESVVKKNRIL